MSLLKRQLGTGHGRELWPVLAVLLLAVLVPTACVLWFMNAAMSSERLAVRQRLTDLYHQRAGQMQTALDSYWAGRLAELGAYSGLPPAERFAKLVVHGAADSVIVFDESGKPAYPAIEAGEHSPPELSDKWIDAQRLELDPSHSPEAASAYAELAKDANAPSTRALALQGQVRCLLQAGKKDDALAVLTGPLAEAELRSASDARGRLIAPSARLLALQLMDDRGSRQFAELLARLAERVNDYGPPPMPSAQRRFLMSQLAALSAAPPEMPTRSAETIAAEYADNPPALPAPGQLAPAHAPGLWQVRSADGSVVVIFSQQRLLGEMTAAAELDEAYAGATFHLVPPEWQDGNHAAFLRLSAGEFLSDWLLDVRLGEQDPFAAASSRQRMLYLWTGLMGVLIVGATGAAVALHLRRQARMTRLKNDLIATVSHELKTPLASMRVLVDTLLAGRCRDDQQQQEYLAMIARENHRLSRLIDNFLTFSRMERNKRAFDFKPLDVEKLVSHTVQVVQEQFNRPGCLLTADAGKDLPTVIGDRDAMVTVLLNLLDNAYKYTGDEKEIHLRARRNTNGICLEVRDNGIGLSRQAARKVFERFYRVDQSLARSAEGCGLGLSIVKFIVDAHGGTVSVDSQPGKGSTFRVHLPAVNESPGASQR